MSDAQRAASAVMAGLLFFTHSIPRHLPGIIAHDTQEGGNGPMFLKRGHMNKFILNAVIVATNAPRG
jgi:hypothetical protein